MKPDPIAKDCPAVAAEGDELRARLKRHKNGDAILDEALIEALKSLVREGMPVEGACQVAGLKRTTLQKWTRQGVVDAESDKDTLYSKLVWALDSAIGDQHRTMVRVLMKGAEHKPELMLNILAVRRPNDWAPAAPLPEDARKLYEGMSEQDLRLEVKRLVEKGTTDVQPHGAVANPDADPRGNAGVQRAGELPGTAKH
jgi:hypothetical protein